MSGTLPTQWPPNLQQLTVHQNFFHGPLVVPASVIVLAVHRNSFHSPFILLGNQTLLRCVLYSDIANDVLEHNCFSNETCPHCVIPLNNDGLSSCTLRQRHPNCVAMLSQSKNTITTVSSQSTSTIDQSSAPTTTTTTSTSTSSLSPMITLFSSTLTSVSQSSSISFSFISSTIQTKMVFFIFFYL